MCRSKASQEGRCSGLLQRVQIIQMMTGQNWFRPQGYKTFFMQTQLTMKFIMLINIKMPTTVGILTFISMKNTTSESFRVRKVFIFQHFCFYKQMKSHAPFSMNKVSNLGAKATSSSNYVKIKRPNDWLKYS